VYSENKWKGLRPLQVKGATKDYAITQLTKYKITNSKLISQFTRVCNGYGLWVSH
jgi:hypothetical protein